MNASTEMSFFRIAAIADYAHESGNIAVMRKAIEAIRREADSRLPKAMTFAEMVEETVLRR